MLAVPSTLLHSKTHTRQVYQVADHARTNGISEEHSVRESVPSINMGSQGGACNPSYKSIRCVARKSHVMGLSEMATNRELYERPRYVLGERYFQGYTATRNNCTDSNIGQGNRGSLVSLLDLDILLEEIRKESTQLLPLLQTSMDANI